MPKKIRSAERDPFVKARLFFPRRPGGGSLEFRCRAPKSRKVLASREEHVPRFEFNRAAFKKWAPFDRFYYHPSPKKAKSKPIYSSLSAIRVLRECPVSVTFHPPQLIDFQSLNWAYQWTVRLRPPLEGHARARTRRGRWRVAHSGVPSARPVTGAAVEAEAQPFPERADVLAGKTWRLGYAQG